MYIQFLGTQAAVPGVKRNPTAYVIDAIAETNKGEMFLVDCAEGTQAQFVRQQDKFQKGAKPTLSRISKVFITHRHLDHIAGLPGFLATNHLSGRKEVLEIYGPKGLKEWVMTTLSYSRTNITYPIQFIEVAEGDIYTFEGYQVRVYSLKHDVTCFAYHIQFDDKKGTLDIVRAKELGVPNGPLLGQLKQGHDVTLSNGDLIRADEVLSLPIRGKSLLLCGDTRFDNTFESYLPYAPDILVYEGTVDGDEMSGKMGGMMHSTYQQAASLGFKLAAKKTLINHTSGRLDLKLAQMKVQAINPTAYIVRDYESYEI